MQMFNPSTATGTPSDWFGDVLSTVKDGFTEYLGYRERRAMADEGQGSGTVYVYDDSANDGFSSGGGINYQALGVMVAIAGLVVAVVALFVKK